MQRLIVATDFSTRADRALRRAVLLARQWSAEVILVHVVDDDQPQRLAEARAAESRALLDELSRTVREHDEIPCESRVVFGDPFLGISRTAHELGADLVLLGPHRRQILRDLFLGTTAERTIKISAQPVLMANGVPAGRYRNVSVAMDFSDCSALAAQTAKRLGLFDQTQINAVHVIEDMSGPIFRSSMPMHEHTARLMLEEEQIRKNLAALLRKIGIGALQHVVRPREQSTPLAIRDWAEKLETDLLVVGTHGRSGIKKWMLGSVAEGVLARSTIDVLAVPAAPKSDFPTV
jgi:nucleotide-binding universal stress UspA family protein